MRPSSRTLILEAALRVAGRRGIGSLTLDAAAQEAGVSKGGLIYHFASKEQLMLGVVEHLIAGWDQAMLTELGRPFDETSAAERVRAYCHVITGATTGRADLAILVDAVHDDGLLQPWRALQERWLGVPPAVPDPRSVDLALARLAADGLWLADASDSGGFSTRTRAAIIARIAALAGGEEEA
ncbi:TetR/AcrR family transcriptional regulator [Nonomuraea sp. NPDC050790]|uniref:TetR/AcrR family transcriptional regulator n=1 Tax=Nonomuraea sp. NPDC050790 TaxID=3364371 RepID=UPI00379BCCF8